MSETEIKALLVDTGGTVLDWHSGFADALARVGARHGVERDWGAFANEIRRRSLARMDSLGSDAPPNCNFDDAHRAALDEILAEEGLDHFTELDRHAIAWEAPHHFACWTDFPSGLTILRQRTICASFTSLSLRLAIDTARHNDFAWDAVISCESIGLYKPLPAAYETAARWLQLPPAACCMVACHDDDLDAARRAGLRTAFVHRPVEWGPNGPPNPAPDPANDYIVDTFPQLAAALDDRLL